MDPDLDESDWQREQYGQLPAYQGLRYYRYHVLISQQAIQHSGAVLFSFLNRELSSLYLNGEAVFTDL